MTRVVVTGMGLVSCLGHAANTVVDALRDLRSGIRAMPEYAAQSLRSQVAGVPEIDLDAAIDRKLRRFMGDAAAYAYVATRSAIADAGLSDSQVCDPRTGVIAGSGGTSTEWQIATADRLRQGGLRKVGPFMVPRCMGSTISASLATAFGITGLSYSISAACATSAHCIGAAASLIRGGSNDIMLAGGGEEEHWGMTAQFDAMGALARRHNDQPAQASRPYDVDRDGFVMGAGAGMLVLESFEHARARNAHVYAELAGYGVSSDGVDMVVPSGEGAVRCMRMALAEAGRPVDYLNTHGTATPVGDIVELKALREVFGTDVPPLSSTKALTGHSLGATGVHEAIYSLLMLEHGFIAGSANIATLDPQAKDFPIVQQTRDARLSTVMSNSFGFGGTNASLIFTKV